MAMDAQEKDLPIPATEQPTEMTPDITNAQLHGQNGKDPRTAMPKRKPVPSVIPPKMTEFAVVEPASNKQIPPSTGHKKALSGFSGWRFRSQTRSRKFLIIGAIAAILLIVLIIGLAVGLTRGKHSNSNLPLPTSNGGPYEGDLTYYSPGLGSCGYTNTGTEMVCAVSHILYDAASTGSNPNDNPLCGLKLRLRRDGKSVDVKIVDRCVGCAVTDLDVTPAVFEKVATLAQGRVSVEWSWLEKPPVSVSGA